MLPRRALPLGRGCVILFSVFFMLSACAKKKETPKAQPVPILAARAVTGDVPVTISAFGAGEAYSTVSVKSLVAGEIMRVHFKEGQDVKKGEALFEIDRRPLEAALNQAKANLARDTVQAENAAKEEVRYADLYKKGMVSEEQYNQFGTAAAAARAVVLSDKAAVQSARVQLGYCTITSPISGRTGNLNVHEGNVVKENDTPYLVVINQIQPINVTFSVPEQYLPDIKKYMAGGRLKVEASAPGGGMAPALGTLSFVDNAVDPATGTIKLKGVFDNKDKRLWPGQFLNVTLTLHAVKGATLAPSQAVQTGQQGQYVFVVGPDLTVSMRPVKTGVSYKGRTVIENGVSPGETVVTDGQLQLVPGAKVRIKAGLK